MPFFIDAERSPSATKDRTTAGQAKSTQCQLLIGNSATWKSQRMIDSTCNLLLVGVVAIILAWPTLLQLIWNCLAIIRLATVLSFLTELAAEHVKYRTRAEQQMMRYWFARMHNIDSTVTAKPSNGRQDRFTYYQHSPTMAPYVAGGSSRMPWKGLHSLSHLILDRTTLAYTNTQERTILDRDFASLWHYGTALGYTMTSASYYNWHKGFQDPG